MCDEELPDPILPKRKSRFDQAPLPVSAQSSSFHANAMGTTVGHDNSLSCPIPGSFEFESTKSNNDNDIVKWSNPQLDGVILKSVEGQGDYTPYVSVVTKNYENRLAQALEKNFAYIERYLLIFTLAFLV
jgi:hypothetical protein